MNCPKCNSPIIKMNEHWIDPLHKCSNQECKISNHWYRATEIKNIAKDIKGK